MAEEVLHGHKEIHVFVAIYVPFSRPLRSVYIKPIRLQTRIMGQATWEMVASFISAGCRIRRSFAISRYDLWNWLKSHRTSPYPPGTSAANDPARFYSLAAPLDLVLANNTYSTFLRRLTAFGHRNRRHPKINQSRLLPFITLSHRG